MPSCATKLIFPIEIEFKSGKSGGYFNDIFLKPRSSQILVFDTGTSTIEAMVRNFHIGPNEHLEVVFDLDQVTVEKE